jgi:hypothetical protein
MLKSWKVSLLAIEHPIWSIACGISGGASARGSARYSYSGQMAQLAGSELGHPTRSYNPRCLISSRQSAGDCGEGPGSRSKATLRKGGACATALLLLLLLLLFAGAALTLAESRLRTF